MTKKVTDKRQAVLDAALELIVEFGFHGAAMSKVAKRAGVSAGIIYHYFKNKDDLISQLYIEVKQRVAKALMKTLNTDLPLRTQIQGICREMFTYNLTHQKEAKFIEQYYSSPYFTGEVDGKCLEFFAPVIEIFDRAVAEKIIKDLPRQVYQTFIVDVANGLAKKQAIGVLELTDDLINQVINATWEALRL